MVKKIKVSVIAGKLILFFVFAGAGIVKILDPLQFQNDLLAYQLFSYPVSFLFSYYFPAFEIVIAFGLFSNRAYKLSLSLILCLLTVFILMLSYTWIIGLDISCGCFGRFDFVSEQSGAIFRDVILIVIASLLFAFELRKN